MSHPTNSHESASLPQRHRRPEQARRPIELNAGRPLTGPSRVLDLQARVGNQAILRLLTQRHVQAKLTGGPANTPPERAADQVLPPPAAAPTPQRAPDEDQPGAVAPPLTAGPQENER